MQSAARLVPIEGMERGRREDAELTTSSLLLTYAPLLVRFSIRDLDSEFTKTEDDIKALQSVGQIIGEVLKKLDDERCESTSPPPSSLRPVMATPPARRLPHGRTHVCPIRRRPQGPPLEGATCACACPHLRGRGWPASLVRGELRRLTSSPSCAQPSHRQGLVRSSLRRLIQAPAARKQGQSSQLHHSQSGPVQGPVVS